ncbi:MAG: hypothetical protein KJZ85_12280 [Rhodobacteraceae bacterium]|jgi:hypothetical protein|nr:hypothetical protein [Paracoccaceae bacterium]
MQTTEARPIDVEGLPAARGRAIAAAGAAQAAAIRARILSAPPPGAEEAAWVEALWQVQRDHLPEVCALIEGLAAGYGVTTRQLFTRHVAYALEDRRLAAPDGPDPDGCSAFAVRGAGGVLVAKNRDNPPAFEPLQTLIRQRGTAAAGGATLAIGTFGSAPAASSGINAAGLCMVDTAVRTTDLGLGVLRYYLMEALLIRCADVPAALAMIRTMPHLGGGNLVLGDGAGQIAAVEIGQSRVAVSDDAGRGWVARTNHFLDPALARGLVNPPGSEPRRDSESRLAFLEARLSQGVAGFTEDDCAALLSSRGGGGFAPLCRSTETVLTLSGAVFDARRRRLVQSRGRPSLGDWRLTELRDAA